MILLLVIFLVAFLFFLKVSDASLNLFFWSRISKRTEADHYRGKVVWLVGGSSGIGEEIAVRLAAFAPLLILSARREDELERVRERCKKVNTACEVALLPLDLLAFSDLPQKVAQADVLFGRKVDIVILNAGRSQRAEWTDIEPEVDIDCFRINAVAPTQLARALLKHRGLHPTAEKKEALQFVVISSVAAILRAVLSASYGAAKAALNQYFRLLALEMGEKGVKVSIVNPSLVFAPNNPLSAFTSEKDAAFGHVIARPTAAHMTPERAAELISLTAVHEVQESIIASSPMVLFLTYLNALAPDLTTRLVLLGGVKRLRAMRTGEK